MYDTTDNRIGEILLDRYQVVGVLGAGGMGVVYEAVDQRLGRHVAIKVLQAKGSTFQQTDMGRRFQREAKAIAALIHPNLVTLIDYDILEDGTPAMVMERVDGVSLQKLLEVRKFTLDEIIELLCQALDALATCHDHGVVHRDLKPGNLLVQLRDGRPVVKIIDFGLTKLVADEAATALTVNGQVFGSPRFMAPEQWLRRQVDGRTDLYAVGLIGYWLITGDHFIARGNPIDVCKAHLHQQRPPLEQTAGGEAVPPALAAAVAKAAHPDPAQRFPDARSMLAMINVLRPRIPNLSRATTGALPAAPRPVPKPIPKPIPRPAPQPARPPAPATLDTQRAPQTLDSAPSEADLDVAALEAAALEAAALEAAADHGLADFDDNSGVTDVHNALQFEGGATGIMATTVQPSIAPIGEQTHQIDALPTPAPPAPPGPTSTLAEAAEPPGPATLDEWDAPEPAHSTAATLVASDEQLLLPEHLRHEPPRAAQPAPVQPASAQAVPLAVPAPPAAAAIAPAQAEAARARATGEQATAQAPARPKPGGRAVALMVGVIVALLGAAAAIWRATV